MKTQVFLFLSLASLGILIISAMIPLTSIPILVKNAQSNTALDPQTSNSVSFLWEYDGGSAQPRHVSLSADGKYLACGEDERVLFFERSSNIPLWSYDTANFVNDVEISADGKYVVAGTTNGLFFFNTTVTAPKSYVWVFYAGDSIECVDISADGSYIAAGSSNTDRAVYLLNSTKPSVEKNPLWKLTASGQITDVALSADGKYVAAGGTDHYLYFANNTYSADSKLPEWSYDTGDSIYIVDIEANGYRCIMGNQANEISLFNRTLTTPKSPIWTYDTPSTIQDVAISANGAYATACTETSDSRLYFFNTSVSAVKTPMWTYQADDFGHRFERAALSWDGEYIAAGSYISTSLYLFNKSITTPKTYMFRNSSVQHVTSLDISEDGRYFTATDQITYTVCLYYHDIPSSTNTDDDDDDKKDDDIESIEIPFGFSFGLFGCLGIIAILLRTKKRLSK